MTTLDEILDELPADRRELIEAHAATLIGEEMSLRELREALHETQVSLAEQLGINQENVSRLERRSDLLLSTLNKYVGAMGGKLSLVVEYPDRPPVVLTGIGDISERVEDNDRST